MVGSNMEIHKTPKPGIVYLSSIPPSMNPLKIRRLLSQYGEVGRLFLQPEDPQVRKRRKKTGGTGRKQFTEGWVEFEDKRIAKSVAATLNSTTLGGKKRYYYHDDMWNIKYLPKFNWGHISEKLAYEKAAREQRMRTEIAQAKREANTYLENVVKGKEITAIEEKKKKKRKHVDDNDSCTENMKKKFHQKPVFEKPNEKGTSSGLNKFLLSRILASG